MKGNSNGEIIDFELKILDYFNHYFTNCSKIYLLLIVPFGLTFLEFHPISHYYFCSLTFNSWIYILAIVLNINLTFVLTFLLYCLIAILYFSSTALSTLCSANLLTFFQVHRCFPCFLLTEYQFSISLINCTN